MKDDIKFFRRRVDTLYPCGERSRLLLTPRTKLAGNLASCRITGFRLVLQTNIPRIGD